MNIRADHPEWQTALKPPFLGFGLGLRPQHYTEILEANHTLPIDEAIRQIEQRLKVG